MTCSGWKNSPIMGWRPGWLMLQRSIDVSKFLWLISISCRCSRGCTRYTRPLYCALMKHGTGCQRSDISDLVDLGAGSARDPISGSPNELAYQFSPDGWYPHVCMSEAVKQMSMTKTRQHRQLLLPQTHSTNRGKSWMRTSRSVSCFQPVLSCAIARKKYHSHTNLLSVVAERFQQMYFLQPSPNHVYQKCSRRCLTIIQTSYV